MSAVSTSRALSADNASTILTDSLNANVGVNHRCGSLRHDVFSSNKSRLALNVLHLNVKYLVAAYLLNPWRWALAVA
jgi:hypothetical protein